MKEDQDALLLGRQPRLRMFASKFERPRSLPWQAYVHSPVLAWRSRLEDS